MNSVLVRYDTSPIGTGKNWVTKTDPVEGLGSFVRAVTHALERNGHSESEAIQIALGVMKRWAAGKGTNARQKHVTPQTQAKAAAAVAHWEQLKASAHSRAAAPAGAWAPSHPFMGNQHVPDPNPMAQAASNPNAGPAATGPAWQNTAGQGAPPSSASGSQAAGQGANAWAAQQQLVQAVGQAQKAYDSAKKAFDAAQRAQMVAQQSADQYKVASTQNLAFAQERLVNTPKGIQNEQAYEQMQTTVQQETDKLALALSNANAATQDAQGSLTLAEGQLLTAMKNAGFRSTVVVHYRDDGGSFVGEGNPAGVGDTSGASHFLPAGPSKKKSKAITDKMQAVADHRFQGDDLTSCSTCGKSVTEHGQAQPIAPVPRQLRTEIQEILDRHDVALLDHLRHRGPGHESVATGHVKRVPARAKKAASSRNLRNYATVEDPMTTSLQHLFADQRTSTLNRLKGKRGGQMLKRAAAALASRDDGSNNPDNSEPIPVESAQIFDPAYWTAKTADAIAPHLAHAHSLATAEVNRQLGVADDSPGEPPSGPTGGSGGPGGTVPPDGGDSEQVWPGGNPGPLQAIVAQRAQAAAHHVTTTTADELQSALQEGVAAGEGRDAIAKRVNAVFDHADMDRAKLIAQTETVGAYNEAQSAYAATLPKTVLGNKVWLAHHDARTRPTHRVADGQERPMGSHYIVGDASMDYPGDKAAPIGEWINCRCSQAFLPPGMTYAPMAAAAQQYMDTLHAKPAPVESPYDVEGAKGP